MNILIVSSLFPPNIYGGAEVVAYNFATSLVRAGHQVHVVTIKEPTEARCWGEMQQDGFKLYKLSTSREHTLYSRTKIKSSLDKFKWHLEDHLDHENLTGWRELLNEIKPDHINIQNIMGFGFNVLPFIADGKVSVTYVVHDYSLTCFKTTMFKNKNVCKKTCLACRPTSIVRQHYLKKMKRVGIISPTRAHLNSLEKLFPYLSQLPSLVMHNPQSYIDIDSLPKYVPSEVTRLIYVGRIDEVKGLSFLLNVLQTLANDHSFHLSVYGTGPQEQELIDKYGKEPWVTFHGFIQSNEIHKFIVQSDYYCIPSLWPEVFGMTTSLSLKLGTPVIGSDIGGTSELINNGVSGILIAPNDINKWKLVLAEIFDNRQVLIKLRKNLIEDSTQPKNSESIVGNLERFLELL